jgi:hypothetical protein
MNKQQIANLEKKLKEYHNSIPDFPINQKPRLSDRLLDGMLWFLFGALTVLIAWLSYELVKVAS